jgi:hypothetical protein
VPPLRESVSSRGRSLLDGVHWVGEFPGDGLHRVGRGEQADHLAVDDERQFLVRVLELVEGGADARLRGERQRRRGEVRE